jgi:outer membrane protein OmpA-like peptidoglycan-associated protein
MSMRKVLLATAALAVVGATGASADDYSPTGWYAGAGAGINWVDDTEETLSGGDHTIEWDTGFVVEGDVGYRWAEFWRLELEASYRENDADVFNPGGGFYSGVPVTAAGDVEQLAVMLNLLFDFDVTDTINFSLGAGIGGAQVEVEFTAATTPFGSVLTLDERDQDWTWAYQGIVGMSFETGDQTEIFLDYRYFVANDVDMVAANNGTPFATFDENFDNHTVKVGFRYFFEGRPEVPPEEPPVVEDKATTYIVFFDFNKSNLTAEAQGVVAEAADAYKATGSVRVQVVGHTDTVGSASYNQNLSERRAASVAAELERLGVPADAITTEGRGFSDPMVPTGPGVREPQNRRAVIDLSK